jgi:hypothetical protein
MAHLYPGYLGILKWSLSQSDGTRPSEFQPMAEEVRAPHERVNCGSAAAPRALRVTPPVGLTGGV